MRVVDGPNQYLISRVLYWYRDSLNSSGRASRAAYWSNLALLLPTLCTLYVVFQLAVGHADEAVLPLNGLLDAVIEIVVLFLVIAVLLVGAAATVRRLHDRNKTGSWISHFLIAPTLFFWLGQAFLDAHFEPVHSLPFLLQFVALFVFGWAFTELCCRRGTVGDNRFGPDPLASRSNIQERISRALLR